MSAAKALKSGSSADHASGGSGRQTPEYIGAPDSRSVNGLFSDFDGAHFGERVYSGICDCNCPGQICHAPSVSLSSNQVQDLDAVIRKLGEAPGDLTLNALRVKAG